MPGGLTPVFQGWSRMPAFLAAQQTAMLALACVLLSRLPTWEGSGAI